MKITVITLARNEEKIMPFFLRHYRDVVGATEIIVLINKSSSDKTEEIVRNFPIGKVDFYDTGGVLRDDIHAKIKSNYWKKLKSSPDWVIVVDCDEFLYHPNMKSLLERYMKEGVTLPLVHGYNMVSDDGLPQDDGKNLLTDIIKTGIITDASGSLTFGKNNYCHGPYHKSAIFRPDKIHEMNYVEGAHFCRPRGTIVKSKFPEIKLLHYKYLSPTYAMKKDYNLSKENWNKGWGISLTDNSFLEDYYSWARKRVQDIIVDEPEFTQDWFSSRIPSWNKWLRKFCNQEINVLEIGVFEGRSTRWLWENILIHPKSRITCIDNFVGAEDTIKHGIDCSRMRFLFEKNIRKWSDRTTIYEGLSQKIVPTIKDSFDFIYIDGSHLASDVFIDAANCWQKLKVGGLLIFDDYLWRLESEDYKCPYPAIDAFLTCFKSRYEMIGIGMQVCVGKIKE